MRSIKAQKQSVKKNGQKNGFWFARRKNIPPVFTESNLPMDRKKMKRGKAEKSIDVFLK